MKMVVFEDVGLKTPQSVTFDRGVRRQLSASTQTNELTKSGKNCQGLEASGMQ